MAVLCSFTARSARAGSIVSTLRLLIVFAVLNWVQAEYCTGYGHICNYPNKCCANKCCILSEDYEHTYRSYRLDIWNMWYFWFIVIIFMTSCFGGCGYWRRRQILLAQHGRNHPSLHGYTTTTTTTTTYHCGRPNRVLRVPLYPRVGLTYSTQIPNTVQETRGLFPAPPPYAEVMRKPSVYPPRYNDADVLPPYPGDSACTATDSSVAVQLSHGDRSSAVNTPIAVASGHSFQDTGAPRPAGRTAASGAGATSAVQGLRRPAAANQWSSHQASAAAAAVAIPDEVDSNGNEINSNIYPDNANLQAASQQAGDYSPASQRLDGAYGASQSSET